MIKKTIKKIYTFFKRIVVSLKLNSILKRDNKLNAIFLIGSPLHGNIGDHAISIAEMKLLREIKNKQIIEIPGEYYNLCLNKIKRVVKTNDIIVITGGGFIGSLWLNEENMVRNVIKAFPNNKIIIMPQTVFFENTEKGAKELQISKEIYEGHKDLWLFVREENSFEYCKKNFEKIKHLFLVPDIVTYLDYELPKEQRSGILLCLREDKERVVSKENKLQLVKELEKLNFLIKETTTVLKRRVSLLERQKVFEEKLLEFKTSKLVITDRLHGMLFAAITATPCIAMNNSSGKVKGVYNWLKELPYIEFVEENENMLEIANRLLALEENQYNVEQYRNEFKKVIKRLEE